MTKTSLFIFLFMQICFLNCSDQSAGNGTETTNGIEGMIQNAEGDILVGAKVFLNQIQGPNKIPLKIDSTLTDKNGRFSFQNLSAQHYAIYAQFEDAIQSFAPIQFKEGEFKQLQLAPQRLQKSATWALDLTEFLPYLPDTFQVFLPYQGQLRQTLISSLIQSKLYLSGLPRDSISIQIVKTNDSTQILYNKDTLIANSTNSLQELDTFFHTLNNRYQPALAGSILLIDDFNDQNMHNQFMNNWWVYQRSGATAIGFWREQWPYPQMGGFSYQGGNLQPDYHGLGLSWGQDFTTYVFSLKDWNSLQFELSNSGKTPVSLCFASSIQINITPLCKTLDSSAEMENFQIALDSLQFDKGPTELDSLNYLKSLTLIHFTVFPTETDSGTVLIDNIKLIKNLN